MAKIVTQDSLNSWLNNLTYDEMMALPTDTKRLVTRLVVNRRHADVAMPKDLSLIEWCYRARWIKGKSGIRPFSFVDHEYLRQIYSDEHKYIVLEKGAQIGMTEYALSRVLYYCDTLARFRAIYFFPTDGDVQDFSGERVNAALMDSPYLQTRCAGIQNVGVKRIGQGTMYFRGMFSKNRAKSVPADLVIFDELDEAKPANKAQAKERLSHSSYGYVIELSTPTLPNRGIDIEFQQSDQCYWHVACGCPNGVVLEQTFPECIGTEPNGTAFLRCPVCGKDHLDPNVPAVVGEYRGWIPDRPELSTQRRGYHVSQLFSKVFSTSALWYDYTHTNDIAEFYNSKLGYPYAGDRMPLTDRIIDDASSDVAIMDVGLASIAQQYRKVYYGIDVGPHEWYIWVHERNPNNGNRRLIWAEAIRNLDTNNDPKKRALEIVNSFEKPVGVIDANPERAASRDFCRNAIGSGRHGQAYMCFYTESGDDKVKTHEEAGQTFRVMVVNAHRTETIDDFVDKIKAAADGRGDNMQLMHKAHPVSHEIKLHLTSLAKVKKTSMVNAETGRQSIGYTEYVYVESGADHFAHAGNYATIAEQAEEPEGFMGFM